MRIRLVTSVDRRTAGLSRFLGASLAAHLGLLAAVALVPALRPTPPLIDATLFVDLVAAAPASLAGAPPPTPPPAAAPPPQPATPAAPPEGVRTETRQPSPAPEPRPEKVPRKDPPPPKRKDPPPSTPPTTPEPSPAPGEPGTGDPDAPPGGASITALEGTGDVALGWFKGQVTAALYRQWRKPILEGLAEVREVRVSFEILRDGRVQGLRLDQPSGVPSLDRSALRAVSDAAPLPALPPNWKQAVLPAAFVFRLYPD